MIPFPHYGDFTAFTPVVPELYWNVYSAEERVKALCMEWVKLTAYTQALADTVNEQYDDLKADIQARYDALDAAVQNIDDVVTDMNERFPQLVNEQVNIEIRRLINSGEFAEMLQAAIEEYWTEYEQRLASAEGNIQTLSGNLDTEVGKLELRDESIQARNIVLIGDSWTDLDSATVEDGTNWTTMWQMLYPGDRLHNFAAAGRGLIAGNPNFVAQVSNAAADTSFDNNDIDLVIVVGDINDWREYKSAGDYSTPIRSLAQGIARNFPNAQPYLFFASCARPLIANDSETGNWNDLTQLNEQLCRFVNETMSSSLGTANRYYRKMHAFNITHMFTEQTFKPWGSADYRRHLSQYGHWQLCKAIDYCVTYGKTPEMYASLNYAPADAIADKIVATIRYTASKFHCDLMVNIPTALTTNAQTYIPIPNTAFEIQGGDTPQRFLANLDDMFPPYVLNVWNPIRYDTNPTKYNPLLAKAINFAPGRQMTTGNMQKGKLIGFFANPLFSASTGNHGLFLKYNGAEINIPAGAYFASYDYNMGEYSPAYMYMEA